MPRRRRNPEGELPYEEWIPAHAVMFGEDGTVSLMTEPSVSNPGSFAEVRKELAGLGITIRKNDYDEYEVNFRGAGEESTYFTEDLEDAYETGKYMASHFRANNAGETDEDRERLRLKQDFLLMLAVDNAGFPESFRITDHVGAPTLASLRQYIHPDWEHEIDHQIRELAREQRIGVPDFSSLRIPNVFKKRERQRLKRARR